MPKRGSPVFNENQKLEFISDTTESRNTASYLMTIFRKTAPYEAEKGSDLCTFTREELTDMMERIFGIRTGSRISSISLVRKYIRWCAEKGKPGVVVSDAGKIRSNKVGFDTSELFLIRNPEHLQVCLDRVYDPEEEETQDNTFRFIFWMAFGGMPEEETYSLTSENISLEHMEAISGSNIAVIYRQALPCVRNCITLTQFRYKNKAYVNAGDIMRNRVPGKELVRGIRERPNRECLRTQISKRMKAARDQGITDAELSYNKVWISGTFYRIREKEVAGISPDFAKIAVASPQGQNMIAKHSDDPKQLHNALVKIERHMRLDYERWKQAVSIT